jgi:hypothetical protein
MPNKTLTKKGKPAKIANAFNKHQPKWFFKCLPNPKNFSLKKKKRKDPNFLLGKSSSGKKKSQSLDMTCESKNKG